MNNQKLYLANVVPFVALAVELTFIVCGMEIQACIVASAVATAAFILSIVQFGGVRAIITAANVGYSFAVVSGTIAAYYVGGLSILLWGGIGIATLLLQIGLTLAYKERGF